MNAARRIRNDQRSPIASSAAGRLHSRSGSRKIPREIPRDIPCEIPPEIPIVPAPPDPGLAYSIPPRDALIECVYHGDRTLLVAKQHAAAPSMFRVAPI
ncbi:hypothetical protein SPHINGOT1_160002 [Sphingomonas sp. T1]|nr:hypothetical protein SPHINGOT1_160002 [Sphingomonas sp. T1]